MCYTLCMKNVKEIIPKNLIFLRKQHKLTQIELSKKINYSDKAVSRWEKGEVLPDVEVLQNICNIYEIPISYIFEENIESLFSEHKGEQIINKGLTGFFLITTIWSAITILFVYLKLFYGYSFWQAFVWGVPISCLVGHQYNKKYFMSGKLTFALHTILIWSTLTCIYLQFIHYNIWVIFFVGIPLQASTISAQLIQNRKKTKK